MKLIIPALLLAFTGCSLVSPKVGPYVVKAANRYCDEPQESRDFLRSQVNAQLAETGHSVRVTCAGDE